MRTSGRYLFVEWTRNRISAGLAGFVLQQPSQGIIDFGEVYYSNATSAGDLGRYEVNLVPNTGQAASARISFAVIQTGIVNFSKGIS